MILLVRHAMKSNPPTINAEATVTETAHTMIRTGCDTLIVLEQDNIKGIVSLRNVLRYTYAQGFRPSQTPVSEITTTNIVLARPSTNLEDALTIMTEMKQETLVVVDDKLVGSINIHDLLKAQPHTKPLPQPPKIQA